MNAIPCDRQFYFEGVRRVRVKYCLLIRIDYWEDVGVIWEPVGRWQDLFWVLKNDEAVAAARELPLHYVHIPPMPSRLQRK